MTKQKRIKDLEPLTATAFKFVAERAHVRLEAALSQELESWPSNAPLVQDHIDAIERTFIWGSREPRPTPRQETLSRLTGRPWDEFIP